MISLIFGLLGGIGLFILGMSLLTDGLKSFAGDRLRLALMNYTDRPGKAFTCGAVVTLLVQSSSATTVTVIGFVSAGLLAFTPAVSVVIGASLGTTGTGWLVSVLGLKVSIGLYALPLIALGAFLRVVSQGRLRFLGLAIAGFGVIFVGIETLQRSMEGLSGITNLAGYGLSGFSGHLLGMAVGFVMTLIMQSSSAAVATILTALHTNSVNFEQAASLVIGASIGTTVTGGLASIGATVAAKRTALAHIIFNTTTGIIAVLLLPFFLWLIQLMQFRFNLEPGAVSLAAFHTLFIGVGVLLFMPFVRRFSGAIRKLLPERTKTFTSILDESVLGLPVIALDAVRRVLTEIALDIIRIVRSTLKGYFATIAGSEDIPVVTRELEKTRDFFTGIPTSEEDPSVSEMRVSIIHGLDHLLRMEEYLYPSETVRRVMNGKEMADIVSACLQLINLAEEGLRGQADENWRQKVESGSDDLIDYGEQLRADIIRRTAEGKLDAQNATHLLDTVRWIIRVGNHIARISLYLHMNTAGRDSKKEQSE